MPPSPRGLNWRGDYTKLVQGIRDKSGSIAMNWGCGNYLRSCLAEVLCRRHFKVAYVALRRRAVVVLVERQGGYFTDVVCDACAIMWALQHTSVQTAGPRYHRLQVGIL